MTSAPTNLQQVLYLEVGTEIQIIYTINSLNAIETKFHHMKGHQDDNANFDDIPWLVKLNVHCDQLVTEALATHSEILEHVPFLLASTISLNIKDRHITHHIRSQIWHIWSQQSHKLYTTKHMIETLATINLELFRHTNLSFSLNEQSFPCNQMGKQSSTL